MEEEAAIEVLDRSHKAAAEVFISLFLPSVGLLGLSLFLLGVWEHGSHLIASSVPVEPAGGDASQTEEKEAEEEKEVCNRLRRFSRGTDECSPPTSSDDQFCFFNIMFCQFKRT